MTKVYSGIFYIWDGLVYRANDDKYIGRLALSTKGIYVIHNGKRKYFPQHIEEQLEITRPVKGMKKGRSRRRSK